MTDFAVHGSPCKIFEFLLRGPELKLAPPDAVGEVVPSANRKCSEHYHFEVNFMGDTLVDDPLDCAISSADDYLHVFATIS